MAKKKIPTATDRFNAGLIDLTKTGPLTYRELQAMNNGLPAESMVSRNMPNRLSSSLYEPGAMNEIHYSGDMDDDWGESAYDSPMAGQHEYEHYQDYRGRRQSGLMQIVNGTLKGALTMGTTFVNGTLGLANGLAQGTINAINGEGITGFAEGIWNNSTTRAMKAVSDWSEKALPNYYTNEELNDPWYTHILSTNFIGDKFLKNMGFTVGAFYSGGLYSKALSMLGKGSELAGAARALASSGISAIGEGSIEAINNSNEWYDYHKKVLDDKYTQDYQKVFDDNYKDKVLEIQKEFEENRGKSLVKSPEGKAVDPAYEKYKRDMQALRDEFDASDAKKNLKNGYDEALKKLKEDKAKMGNMDLLMNIGILTASNMFQFGKLWSNGFKTAKRTSKIVNNTGKDWKSMTMAEKKAAVKSGDFYKAQQSKIEPWLVGSRSTLSEGFEEINQKAASEISGDYYGTDVMNYYKAKTDPDGERETVDFLTSFGRGLAKTYSDLNSWEEFFIGSLTGAIGMPVFGKANTQQAYIGKDKSFGMVGGFGAAFNDYNDRVARDTEIANALNERMKNPDFLNYYQGMIRHYKEQKEMDKAVDAGDNWEFKNHEHNQMVNDIATWDNAGKIEDLLAMIDDASDTSAESIKEILQQTSDQLKSHPKFKENIEKLSSEIEDIQDEVAKLSDNANEALNNNDIETYNNLHDEISKLGRQLGAKEAELQEQQNRMNLTVGAYVDENGNPYSEEHIKQQLEANKKDLIDTINYYRDTKREIDSNTNYRFDSEQLGILTWLKAHTKNWEDRATDMSETVKQIAIPAILDDIERELAKANKELDALPTPLTDKTRKKAAEIQENVKAFTEVRTLLNDLQKLEASKFGRALALDPSIGQLIQTLLPKPSISESLKGDTAINIMQQIDDIIKCTNAASQYNEKLMEYLLTPEALEEDMATADKEAMDRVMKEQTKQIRQHIADNVKSVPQMREALQGLGEKEDAIVNSLISDEDKNISSLAKAYKKIRSLERIAEKEFVVPARSETDAAGIEAARQTFKRLLDKADSLDTLLQDLKNEVERALANSNDPHTSTKVATYEAIVANKLQDILDAYEEAKSSKSSEKGNDSESEETPKKRKKGKKGKKAVSKGSKGGTSSVNVNILDEEFEEEKSNPKESEKPEEEEEEEEEKKKEEEKEELPEEIDYSILSTMSVDEAINYLSRIIIEKTDLSKEEIKKIDNLWHQMMTKKVIPSAHESSNDDNSNANDNDTSATPSTASIYRNWWAARYDFGELSDRYKRRAVYNSYPAAQKQLEALERLGAFDFVERGELGKLFKANPDLKIHYIKAKEEGLSDTILLAVEIDDNAKRIAKPVHIITGHNSKKYQAVGVLGHSSSDPIAKSNWNEVNFAIRREKGSNDSEYFVSDKFYNKIKHIYSGRMVKSGEVRNADGNISGEIEDRSLNQVLHGVKPVIGVWYNAADFRVPLLPNDAEIVPLNTNNTNPREGSVWLMVQEADGKYYAKSVHIRRFTVDEYDIEEHKNSPILKQILDDLEVICDPDAKDIDRYIAKYDLQEHLLYFPEDINILYNKDVVTIKGIEDGDNIGKGLSPKEKAEILLDKLQSDDLNLRFQIETSQLADMDYVQELLDSDVMTTDLLQARNINASFDMYLNDYETGEPIEENMAKESSHTGHTGNREVNIDLSGETINIGIYRYTLLSDGRVMRRNQEVTDENIIEQVRLINNINKGLVNPIEGTNLYLGVYGNGTKFGIKKNKSSYSIVTEEKLDSMINKAEKLNKKKEKRKATKEAAEIIQINEEEQGGQEEDVSFLSLFGVAEEDIENEEENEEENKETPPALPQEENKPKPKKKPKKYIGLYLQEDEEDNAPLSPNESLKKIAKKKKFRTKAIPEISDAEGKQVFKNTDEFLAYVQDPKNGLSTVIVETEEDMEALIESVKCRIL